MATRLFWTLYRLSGMRICWLTLIVASLALHPATAQRIEHFSRIDIPLTKRSAQFGNNEIFAEWLNDVEIVSYTRDWRLARVDVSTKEKKWSRKWLDGVSDFSVCASQMRIALICKSDLLKETKVVLVHTTDGSSILSTDSRKLSELADTQFFLPTQIAIHPKNGSVLISNFSTHFGDNAYLFNNKLDRIDRRIGVDSMPGEISFTENADRLTILADFDVLNIRDISKNSDIYFAGKRYKKPRTSITSVVDAPFFSNAYHDGENMLVYSRDNSWATGRIFVHELDKKTKNEFDGLNGHIVMDVDFANKRIAASGTSKDISLFDFNGNKLAELTNATGKRNFNLRFSPDGKKLLICNSNAIWIFAIKPE